MQESEAPGTQMEEGLSPKDRYMELLLNPDFDTLKKEDIAKEVGADRKTIWRWNKDIDWGWVKEERRRRYASVVIELDKALIREAKKGNVKAIETCYQRFDGWTPTSAIISNAADSEIEAELQKILERKRNAVEVLKATNDDAGRPAN